MIRTFRHRGLERFFRKGDHRGILAKHEARTGRMLDGTDTVAKPEDMAPALGTTQTEFAQRLGVPRLSVSEVLHEKRTMTPEMAARVAKLLNTTPESWLRMQAAVDLWDVQQHPERLAGIKPIKARVLAA